jgi:hypothetical protein
LVDERSAQSVPWTLQHLLRRMSLIMAQSDLSQRCKAMSDLGATADLGRHYWIDGSVAVDPTATFGNAVLALD